MVADVFIGHATEDAPLAGEICNRLEERGLACWYGPRDAAADRDLTFQTVEALDAARVVVLLLSAQANGSSIVSREAERASSQGKPVIPVRIDNAAPSEAIAAHLGGRYPIDVSGDALSWQAGLLANAVSVALAGAAAPPRPAAAAPIPSLSPTPPETPVDAPASPLPAPISAPAEPAPPVQAQSPTPYAPARPFGYPASGPAAGGGWSPPSGAQGPSASQAGPSGGWHPVAEPDYAPPPRRQTSDDGSLEVLGRIIFTIILAIIGVGFVGEVSMNSSSTPFDPGVYDPGVYNPGIDNGPFATDSPDPLAGFQGPISVPADAPDGVVVANVEQGDLVVINATGDWCTVDGDCGGPDGILDAYAGAEPLLAPGKPLGLLVGRIGDGEWWPAATFSKFVVTDSGPLVLTFNRAEVCDACTAGNTGALEIMILVQHQ